MRGRRSRSSAFLARVIARVNELEPDFLCITGDFIDARGVTVEELRALRSVTCPIYFSIGNHERYEDLDAILARLNTACTVVCVLEAAIKVSAFTFGDYIREPWHMFDFSIVLLSIGEWVLDLLAAGHPCAPLPTSTTSTHPAAATVPTTHALLPPAAILS